ncbi:DUF6079 family protein [Brevibacterium litoralis]|uniref:DUF6079 family protein n=1 Tax=Brevibacterium litoralis TaxID=3138935 RepID=UPI0032ECB7D8
MLLRDAIHINPEVHDDDFVLQISRIEEAHAQMVRDYVVTPEIAEQFDSGLSLVSAAVRGPNRSKGAFVHGSFGSGKSHYMAVMHLLLTGDVQARSIPGLAPVVAKYSDTLQSNFLAVDYHLIGSTSFDDALFRGYNRTIRAKHPNAPLPVLQQADLILENADRLREAMGDTAFFANMVPAGGSASGEDLSGWGDFAPTGSMTAEDYDRARHQEPGSSERDHLVAQILEHHLTSAQNAGEWLDMTEGLAAMTRHAKSLGYDGIILFLDELVLWLANHVRNSEFIATEIEKVTKLVETGASDLALPLVSFVARQRNLKDFLGDAGVGAEKIAVDQNFKHWESRFTSIQLPATSLPEIVHRRLLQSTGPEGESALQTAFTRVKADPTASTHLMAGETRSDGAAFEKVYPFAPALIDVMIALSNVMQRSRTALKIMSELLARGYDELTVDDVIQAGDIFDLVVLENDEGPLDAELKPLFRNARDFYLGKIRPYLLNKHGLTEESLASAPRDGKFRREDRLAKTLLMSAVVPGAESMKNLTASKLAALNFGSVMSMIPGMQATQVVNLVREWARQWDGIAIADGVGDPVITMTLSGVDTEGLLEQVAGEDSMSSRARLVQRELAGLLQATQQDTSLSGANYSLSHVWQGQKRTVDLVFGNLRDTDDLRVEKLRAVDGKWRLVVDYPFDPRGQGSAQDDRLRMQQLREQGIETDSVAWLPVFLTAERMEDLGTLVKVDYLLEGSKFDNYADILPLADREPAKRDLQNKQRNLRASLSDALKQAYGIETAREGVVDAVPTGWQFFHTLAPDFDPSNPAAATFRDSATAVLDAALDARNPQHVVMPDPTNEVRSAEIKAVLGLVTQAMDSEGRIETVDRSTLTRVRRLVEGLRIGRLTESTYDLSNATFGYLDDFRVVGTSATVSELRIALDHRGLSRDLEDLLIRSWAALTDRQATRSGTPWPDTTSTSSLPSDVTYVEPKLPTPEEWRSALLKAQEILHVGAGEHALLSKAVSRVSSQMRSRAQTFRVHAQALVDALEAHSDILALNEDSPRLHTARVAADLMESLVHETDDVERVRVLAHAEIAVTNAAVAASLSTSEKVSGKIRTAHWTMIDRLPDLDAEAASTLRHLREALRRDEYVQPLGNELAAAAEAAASILSRRAAPTPSTPPADPVGPGPDSSSGPRHDPLVGPNPVPPAPVVKPDHENETTGGDDQETLPQLHGEATVSTESAVKSLADKLIQDFADAPSGTRLHVTWRAQ